MRLYADGIFPHILEFVMSRPHMMKERHRALADARGEVLEIGFGTGLNLSCYPTAVDRLTVLDPADILKKKVARRIAAAPMPVDKVQLDAKELPFDAGRFDCVVSTWTLCTIPEVEAALREVRRVMKSGGSFLFLEHGRSSDERVVQRQDRWNWLQRIVGVGCNLNRPIDRLVEDAGFELRKLERFQMPQVPRMAAEHYLGQAMRA
jgi:ubiquinone/menaquinone biosynthesis C-methylase UbiE